MHGIQTIPIPDSSHPRQFPPGGQFPSRTGSHPGQVPIPDRFPSRTGSHPGQVPIPDRFPSRTGSHPGQVPIPDRFPSRTGSHPILIYIILLISTIIASSKRWSEHTLTVFLVFFCNGLPYLLHSYDGTIL